jgi:hypothetical protein
MIDSAVMNGSAMPMAPAGSGSKSAVTGSGPAARFAKLHIGIHDQLDGGGMLSCLFSRKSAVSADAQIFRRDLAAVFLLFVADLCALIQCA